MTVISIQNCRPLKSLINSIIQIKESIPIHDKTTKPKCVFKSIKNSINVPLDTSPANNSLLLAINCRFDWLNVMEKVIFKEKFTKRHSKNRRKTQSYAKVHKYEWTVKQMCLFPSKLNSSALHRYSRVATKREN